MSIRWEHNFLSLKWQNWSHSEMSLKTEIHMVFTEIGIGNKTFISTEMENPVSGAEVRVPGFVKMDVEGFYLRFWLGKRVTILSSKDGVKVQRKTTSRFKILFGVQGKITSMR